MTFPTPDEHDLAELRAQVDDVGRSLDEVTERLRRLAGGQDRQDAATDDGAAPLVVFVHIPKTAGGTLTTMFAYAWPKTAVHKAGNFMRGPQRTVNKVTRRPDGWESWHRDGGRLAVGHVPYRIFHDRLPADCSYITILRDPVDRVLSHYYRHLHDSDPDEDPWTPGRGATASSLEEAIVEQRLPQVNNLATRFLCDDPEADELGDEALAQAKANLRRFAFVGIQERFEESVVLLQRTLGLGVVPYGADRHVSTDRPAVDEISDEQRELIEQHNRLDAELYEYGRDLFEAALVGAGDELASHLAELRIATAAANEADAADVKAAYEWLDRELPLGSTRPRADVAAAAREAGVRRTHFQRAMRQLPGVEKWGGDTGEVKLTRVGEPGSDTAVQFEQDQAAREEALLQEALEWIKRELPPGATKARDSLGAAAEDAGIHFSHIKRALEALPGVERSVDDTGEVELTRTDASAG